MEAPALSEKLTTGESFEDEEATSDEPKHPAIQIGRRVFMVIMMAWCMLVPAPANDLRHSFGSFLTRKLVGCWSR